MKPLVRLLSCTSYIGRGLDSPPIVRGVLHVLYNKSMGDLSYIGRLLDGIFIVVRV